MMHYTKVVQGLAMYAENELVGKIAGSLKGWSAGAAVAMLADRADAYVRGLLDNEMARTFRLVDGENVDVDAVYRYVLPQARKGSATVAIPFMGAVTFSEADVEAAYRYIKGA